MTEENKQNKTILVRHKLRDITKCSNWRHAMCNLRICECKTDRDLKEALVEVKENSKRVCDGTLIPTKVLVDINYLFVWNILTICLWKSRTIATQKMKFPIKDFFSKCDQIRSFLRIWSHLLRKSLMENNIFCAVYSEKFVKLLSGLFHCGDVSSAKLPSDDAIKEHLKMHIISRQICTFSKGMWKVAVMQGFKSSKNEWTMDFLSHTFLFC